MNDLTNALKNYDKALKIKSDYLPSLKVNLIYMLNKKRNLIKQ